MIESIEYRGRLIYECSLPGETRKEGIFPAHPNGIPVSRNRWLLVYATRAWRCGDDELSIIYQIRENSPDGTLLKEGLIKPSINDWDPFGDGSALVRQQGSPVAFGVPKGALIGGKPAINANVFAVKWRVMAPGRLDRETGLVERDNSLWKPTQHVEWMQFRLNETEDDIEVLQETRIFTQKGFEDGGWPGNIWSDRELPQSVPPRPGRARSGRFCGTEGLYNMSQTFVQPVPFNDDATEWADVNNFNEGIFDEPGAARSAALKHRFNPETGLYEWVEIGPAVEECKLGYASVACMDDGWIIGSERHMWENGGWEPGVVLLRSDDPFSGDLTPVWSSEPPCRSPATLYRCADGILRLFTGDPAASPYGHTRNPLYCWDIDPLSAGGTNRREIFDNVKLGVLPEETVPRADDCKVLPYAGGREQYLLWRVRTMNIDRIHHGLPPVTEECKEKHGIYYAVIRYSEEPAQSWQYEN